VEINLYSFLTSALGGGDWSASRSGLFTPGTHWIVSWMSPIKNYANAETLSLKVIIKVKK